MSKKLSTGLLSYDEVKELMLYLGHHDNDLTRSTAKALAGKVKENAMFPQLVTDEMARQKQFTETVDPE